MHSARDGVRPHRGGIVVQGTKNSGRGGSFSAGMRPCIRLRRRCYKGVSSVVNGSMLSRLPKERGVLEHRLPRLFRVWRGVSNSGSGIVSHVGGGGVNGNIAGSINRGAIV